jgi:hypothetical protein
VRYSIKTTVNAPIERAFDFCANPANFQPLTPEVVVSREPPGDIGQGTVFAFEGNHGGRVEMAEFERPNRFVTESDYGTGAFTTVNTFEPTGDGRTILRVEGPFAVVGGPRVLRPLLALVLAPLVWRERRRVVTFVRRSLDA